MSKSDDPDPGGGENPGAMSSINTLPATSVWAGGRSGAESVKMRSFEEIIQDAKSNRNVLVYPLETSP